MKKAHKFAACQRSITRLPKSTSVSVPNCYGGTKVIRLSKESGKYIYASILCITEEGDLRVCSMDMPTTLFINCYLAFVLEDAEMVTLGHKITVHCGT